MTWFYSLLCLLSPGFMQTSPRDLGSWALKSSSLCWTSPSCPRTPCHRGGYNTNPSMQICGLICIDGLRSACPLVYFACLFLCPCCVIILLLLSYPSLQDQLRRLYPRLKVLAFGAKPESTLHTYLPSFLSRATPHCPDDMKREVRESLTHLVTC